MAELFSDGIRRLIGHVPWAFAAGPGTGSVFTLEFGSKIPLRRRVENPMLDDILRTHRGEFHLMVECAWRLEHGREVVCSWTDSNAVSGPMQEGLRNVIGRVVCDVGVAEPAFDLEISFRGGYLLRVFCDRVGCYHLISPEGFFAVQRPAQVVVRTGPSRS